MRKKRWTKIGLIDVDAGLCWIGDPCYLADGKAPFQDWRKFCDVLDIMFDRGEGYQEFNHETGHSGMGILTRTGAGDGTYPVYAELDKGTVKRVLIDFWGGPEDDEPQMARAL